MAFSINQNETTAKLWSLNPLKCHLVVNDERVNQPQRIFIIHMRQRFIFFATHKTQQLLQLICMLKSIQTDFALV